MCLTAKNFGLQEENIYTRYISNPQGKSTIYERERERERERGERVGGEGERWTGTERESSMAKGVAI